MRLDHGRRRRGARLSHPPPRKSLGQHFLHEKRVVDTILRHFAPAGDDIVVEIGPGRGVLTEALAPRVAAVHAVEIDRSLADQLAGRQDIANLTVHRGDALRFDYCSVGPRIRVIGNLPYNISTPILFRLLEHASCIRDMHLMLQKEVVDRMLAGPGGRIYGRLSVMVQQRCHGTLVTRVPPGAFTPPPRVHSAVVELVPAAPTPFPVTDPEHFARLVQRAFAQRRKTLRNALKGMVSAEQIEAGGIAPDRRPEQVGVAGFADLSNLAVRG